MRDAIASLEGSKIREVANAGLGRSDVLAFWFGESDEVTPQFVRDEAKASLDRGETFYSHNLGIPELRQGLAEYTASLHGPIGADRMVVTSSGVSGLMLAAQLLMGAGDDVVAVTPVWPNLTAQPHILGAHVRRLPLRASGGAWHLDMDRLVETVRSSTKVLLINAPNNPSGWTLSAAEQQAILDHCRKTGTWIVADEVYERLYFGEQAAAPSFLDIADPEDRVIVVHSFSKSFLMTGWRLGWMVVPTQVLDALGKLTEFNTSCAPVFVQRAGQAALRQAASTVPALRDRMRECRDRLVKGLKTLPNVEVAAPLGGMYAFLKVPGQQDSLSFAKHLVTRHGLGLAPGVAFGPEGEGWLRWCFASRDLSRLDRGLERLADAVRS